MKYALAAILAILVFGGIIADHDAAVEERVRFEAPYVRDFSANNDSGRY